MTDLPPTELAADRNAAAAGVVAPPAGRARPSAPCRCAC